MSTKWQTISFKQLGPNTQNSIGFGSWHAEQFRVVPCPSAGIPYPNLEHLVCPHRHPTNPPQPTLPSPFNHALPGCKDAASDKADYMDFLFAYLGDLTGPHTGARTDGQIWLHKVTPCCLLFLANCAAPTCVDHLIPQTPHNDPGFAFCNALGCSCGSGMAVFGPLHQP